MLQAVQNTEEKKVDEILSSIDSAEAMHNIVNMTDIEEKSALHWAYIKNNNKMFAQLLDNGANYTDKLKLGKVVLSMFC